MSIGIGFRPKSLLAFIVSVSLIFWFGAIMIGNQNLSNIASSVFGIFAFFFVVFLILALARNVRRF